MYSFQNDYSEGAHEKVLERLIQANSVSHNGYGLDEDSEKARALLRQKISRQDADIHFIPGGTQTNLLLISSALRPFEAVISADSGHINVHETGAIEATGHKVIAMPCVDDSKRQRGKLTIEQLTEAIDLHTDEHMVKPAMVYLSNSTEYGTVYTKQELTDISKFCRKNGLLLYLDGARLGTALVSEENDLKLSDLAALTDAFYIGGTKNGALCGEALVLCKDELKKDFRFHMKQRGAMFAKGFVLGLQFLALFEDDLYFGLARHANQMAARLAKAFAAKGFSFYAKPQTNQLFLCMSKEEFLWFQERFLCLSVGRTKEGEEIVRFVTSFATTKEGVEELEEALRYM